MRGKKRSIIRPKHWQHLLIAICFSSFMLLLIWFQINYPFAIRQHFLRLILYSFTMAIPSILTLGLNLILPLKEGLPAEAYYVIAFVTYLTLSYYVLQRHHLTDIDLRSLFRKKALVTALLVALFFFTILTIIYYR
jgi:hypothetical protein